MNNFMIYYIVQIWKDPNAMKLFRDVQDQIEQMNPDSLIKILQGICLRNSKNEIAQQINKQVLELLIRDQNILLFDNLQIGYCFIQLSKLDSQDIQIQQYQKKLIKMVLNKMIASFKDYNSELLIRIYAALLKSEIKDNRIIKSLNEIMIQRLQFLIPKDVLMILYVNYKCNNNMNENSQIIIKGVHHLIRDEKNGAKQLKLKYQIILLKIVNEFNFELGEKLIQMIIQNLQTDQQQNLNCLWELLNNFDKYSQKNKLKFDVLSDLDKQQLKYIQFVELLIFFKKNDSNNQDFINFLQNVFYRKYNKVRSTDLQKIFNVLTMVDPQTEVIKKSVRQLFIQCYKIKNGDLISIIQSIRQIHPNNNIQELCIKQVKKIVKQLSLNQNYQGLQQNLIPTSYLQVINQTQVYLPEDIDQIKRVTHLINTHWLLLLICESNIIKNTIWDEFINVLQKISTNLLTHDNMEKLIQINSLVTKFNLYSQIISIQQKLHDKIDHLTKQSDQRKHQKEKIIQSLIQKYKHISIINHSTEIFQQSLIVDFQFNLFNKKFAVVFIPLPSLDEVNQINQYNLNNKITLNQLYKLKQIALINNGFDEIIFLNHFDTISKQIDEFQNL